MTENFHTEIRELNEADLDEVSGGNTSIKDIMNSAIEIMETFGARTDWKPSPSDRQD